MFHRSLLCSALAVGLWPPVAMAAMTETVSPAAGPPTTYVKVTGAGYIGNSLIDIYFDNGDYCVTLAKGSGAYSCTFQIPAWMSPNQHWISVVQRSSGLGVQKPFLVRTDLPQFHGRNAAHSGANLFENTIGYANVSQLDTLWAVPIGSGGTYGSAVVSGGRVYVGGFDGNLYAFNAITGAAIAGFPVNTGASIQYSTPAVALGRVYVGGVDGKLHAYNAGSGAAVAGFPITLGGIINSPPTVALGNVYIGCDDGKLYAFNATSGAVVTGFPVAVNGAVYDAPTLANGNVYLGSRDHKIYAFNALTGAPVTGFPITTGGFVDATIAVYAGMGFVGSNDGILYGFSLADGSALAGFPATVGSAIGGSSAVGSVRDGNGTEVFVASANGKLNAYAVEGNSTFSVTLDAASYGSAFVADDVVYISSQKSIYAYSAGRIQWRASAAATTGLNSPVVSDGIVYYPSNDGRLYAYAINGLTPASRLPGGSLGVPPALSSLKPDLGKSVSSN